MPVITRSDMTTHEQGCLELLDTAVARDLVASAIPTRVAYIAADSTPRIVSTRFHWTNGELVMPTFIRSSGNTLMAYGIEMSLASKEVALVLPAASEPCS